MTIDDPMDRSNHPEVNLRKVPVDEIFGELRRRRLSEGQVFSELDVRPEQRRDLRQSALLLLGVLTFLLIILIGYLAIDDQEIPDLISGLAGSGIGAIAGILSGGTGANEPRPRAEERSG
jgi:hypothetical protein